MEVVSFYECNCKEVLGKILVLSVFHFCAFVLDWRIGILVHRFVWKTGFQSVCMRALFVTRKQVILVQH